VLRWVAQDELAQIEQKFGAPFMQPAQVAETIVFLLSDAARGITGAILDVNLGVYMPH
jgi:enoyl-[acyl-carrier-protein] reductase (NADH)